MHARRALTVIVPMALASPALCQVTYPDCYIQNVDWTAGDHIVVMPQAIYSPGDAGAPASTTATANTEFVSATQIRLTPGFHAGDLNTGGQFHARINPWMGDPEDLVVITEEPYSNITDDVVHVKKWEKFELGYRLPQDYHDAIDRFFRHYYPNNFPPFPVNGPYYSVAVPGNVVAVHDLNPFADDSLQLVMTLSDPSGDQRMKWGFYMKEADWTGQTTNDSLFDDVQDVLHPFPARFRFAPDEEGVWQFALSIKAPHTLTLADATLPEVYYAGYSFTCDPPLPDNPGPLQVNENNRRVLEFPGDGTTEDDDIPFFGVGVNMADAARSIEAHTEGTHWTKYYFKDFDMMKKSVEQLHEVGGNFMRTFLMRNIFQPEWVNLGVYDAFRTPQVCDPDLHNEPCNNEGWSTKVVGNCQYQCWAFDRVLDHARANNIYIQLCIDPYPPIVDYERFIWGAHPYLLHYIEPYRTDPVDGNPYDLKRFFYSNVDPHNTQSARLYNEGVFYYWKRKYKYIMSRWGYSVNVPIIEPFNEPDQMLSYRACNMVLDANTPNPPADPCDFFGGECVENRVDWVADPLLPGTYNDWLTDIISFVQDPVEAGDPVHSPLGESSKMFISGTGYEPNMDPVYLPPNQNPKLDLIDVHEGLYNEQDLHARSAEIDEIRDAYAANGVKRPFSNGEFTHYVERHFGTKDYGLTPFFHNYEIAFHNELWSSAFSGKFAAGMSWEGPRVFWWEDSQKPPPPDTGNPFQWPGSTTQQFANAPGEVNEIEVNDLPYEVENRSAYHNFKPLTDLINHPSWLAYNFFNNDYMVRQWANINDLEAYYLQNGSPSELSTVAIGWVRNLNSSIFNSYYLASTEQQFFSCEPPESSNSDAIYLFDFVPGTYHVTWFPTRWNSTVHPPNGEVGTLFSSTLLRLDLEDQFGGIDNDYLDTLRGDYAFIITPEFFVKSIPNQPIAQTTPADLGWDFRVHPNPAREGFTLRFPDDAPKEVMILDLSGRLMARKAGVTATSFQFPDLRLAQGAYWIRVSDGVHHRTRKLIIQ